MNLTKSPIVRKSTKNKFLIIKKLLLLKAFPPMPKKTNTINPKKAITGEGKSKNINN